MGDAGKRSESVLKNFPPSLLLLLRFESRSDKKGTSLTHSNKKVSSSSSSRLFGVDAKYVLPTTE